MRYWGILFILLLSCSCSVFPPVQSQSDTTYELKTVPYVAVQKRHSTSLLVLEPEASPAYNTTRIAYTSHPYQISYFAKNNWIESPTKMLELLMIETLQNTHYFRAAISPSFVGHYDYILHTQLLKFQQDFTRHPSVWRLTVRAQLTSASRNRVIASKSFTVVIPAVKDTPYGGVLAANHATSEFLRRLVGWVRHSLP